jgi:hypothetical protein
MVILGGKPALQRTLKLRPKDPSNLHEVTLFHDPGQQVVYQVTRFTPQGEKRVKGKVLQDDFLLIGSGELQ